MAARPARDIGRGAAVVRHLRPDLSRRESLKLAGLAGLGLLAPGLLAGCGGGTASFTDLDYAATRRDVQALAREILAAGGCTALGVALVVPGRTVWAESFGVTSLATGQPVSGSTRFGVASVTKVTAAVAVMQLVERGLVDLDAPLVHYVPAFRMADPRHVAITVRMLLDHSSGLPGSTYRNVLLTAPHAGHLSETLATLATQRLKAAPGAMCAYCNDGFTLVEVLVEAVTGTPYTAHLQAAVLDPLGMCHSGFALAPFAEGTFARAHAAGEPLPQEMAATHAEGGLYTTPADLAAFAQVFLDAGRDGPARLLSPASVARMAADQVHGTFDPFPSAAMTYGLAWDSVAEPGLGAAGVRAWTKNGGSFHYGAQLLVAPDAGLAVAVMGTQGGAFGALPLAQRVMLDALVESGRLAAAPPSLAPVAAAVEEPPAGLLAGIAGEYANYEKLVRLRAEPDGSLTMLEHDGADWTTVLAGLRHRRDGWFTAEAAPLMSLKVVEAGGTQYLGARVPEGVDHYLVANASGQRVRGRPQGLSAAWTRRLAESWLVVNESPDSLFMPDASNPRFTLAPAPDLRGLLVARPPGILMPNVLDATGSDTEARTMLAIPGTAGRDLNDLLVLAHGAEEWLRWGGWLLRPASTVPALGTGTATVVTGPEGHTEWRALATGAAPATVTLAGARAWRLYDAGFALLASGRGTGRATVPAGTGRALLAIFGDAGDRATVSVA